MLTLDQWQRRGSSLVNGYFLCKVKEESTDHILIHCIKTFMIVVVILVWCILMPFFHNPRDSLRLT